MLNESFEQIIQQLCEDVLSEPNPEALPKKIIDHVQMTFPVQWSTLWLTEQKGAPSEKQLRLKAAGGLAKKLLTAENGEPAVYDFGQGLTGEIAQQAQTINITCYEDFKKYHHAKKYDSVMYGASSAENECRCVLGVPLKLKSAAQVNSSDKQPERVIGILKLENIEVSAEHPEAYFTPQDVKIVEAYAAVVTVALVKAQMRAESIRIGAGLLEVSRSLLAGLGNVQEIPNLELIVQQTAKVISAEACSLWIRSGLELRLKADYGYSYDGNRDDIKHYELGSKTYDSSGIVANDSTEKLGLTVYVARSGKSLNLQTADEIYNHSEWRGEQAKYMWANKAQDKPCYSLVGIPLIDGETGDLRGVFKIENKLPTLFQLESFFTKEDEQLLTILGNSITFSLIISERIERLKRLERLVGDVRFLDNLDEALFFILTGLTHRDGLQYNRAMIYLVEDKPGEEGKPTRLICQFAIGEIEKPEWQKNIDRIVDEPFLDLDKQMDDFRKNKAKYLDNPMKIRWKGQEIDIADPDQAASEKHAVAVYPGSLDELNDLPNPKQILNVADTKMLSQFAQGEFVLIPITVEKKLKGIIYADNRFTENRVNKFECTMLDLFAGMAGAVIQASGVPGKLIAERDEAWRTFSRPAAHRLGTEASIIDTEVVLYIKPELEQATPNPDGRIAVRGEVIANSLKVIQQALSRLRLHVRDYQRLAFDAEEPVKFDLCDLVEQTIRNTTNGLKGIKVSPLYREQPLWVCAARGGITYVFEELLINAWKGAPSDDELETSAERSEMQVRIELSRQQNSAVCIVSDNGFGIPAELIQDIFKKPTSGRRGGTGLGLYIVKQILDQNHANIELLSTNKPPGFNGACFKITIPLLPHSAMGVRRPPEILVVEDNPVQRKHLSKVLTDSGFTCELVQNENEAMDKLSSTLRAIVADINLSEAGGTRDGGIRLAEKLKDRQIPIILISEDPWYYLPDKDSQKFKKMQEELSIVSVINRNTSSSKFYEELVRTLENTTNW